MNGWEIIVKLTYLRYKRFDTLKLTESINLIHIFTFMDFVSLLVVTNEDFKIPPYPTT